jgi:predicted  nucleic acid-binding Zn-ribbon protein
MKGALKRLGVIGPRHYRHLLEQLQKAEVRHAKLIEELDRARASAKAYQSKVGEVEKALRSQRADAAYYVRRTEKLAAEIERLRTESRLKLETVKRDLTVAREALMAVDVKLDILEGAANVLDLRTRDVAARRGSTTERAV